MNKKEVELGDEVCCKVTGHKGIVTSIAKCLTGCDRVEVTPTVDKEGKMKSGYWIDQAAVKILKKQKVKPEHVRETESKELGTKQARMGGPMTISNRHR